VQLRDERWGGRGGNNESTKWHSQQFPPSLSLSLTLIREYRKILCREKERRVTVRKARKTTENIK
jgi:hypothetical protein